MDVKHGTQTGGQPRGVHPSLRPPWLDEHLYPFASQYLDISGCRMHYIDEGSGPVLLFLHGNPTWSFLHRDIVKGLRGGALSKAGPWQYLGLASEREFALQTLCQVLQWPDRRRADSLP